MWNTENWYLTQKKKIVKKREGRRKRETERRKTQFCGKLFEWRLEEWRGEELNYLAFLWARILCKRKNRVILMTEGSISKMNVRWKRKWSGILCTELIWSLVMEESPNWSRIYKTKKKKKRAKTCRNMVSYHLFFW